MSALYVTTLFVVLSLHLHLQDDTFEETGWKLVHGDVFRPPNHPMLLSAFLGSGIQIFCMVLIILGEGGKGVSGRVECVSGGVRV